MPDLLTANDCFTDNTAWRADKTAVIVADKSYSFGQLDRRAGQLARLMLDQEVLSGREVTRVGLHLTKSFDAIAAIWACLKRGWCFVPLVPELPADRLRFMAADSSVDLVLTNVEEGTDWGRLPVCHTGHAAEAYADCASPADVAKSDSQTAYVIYTSGSTGKPKGVPISFGNLAHLVRTAARPDVFDIRQDSIFLNFASISFDASVIEIIPVLAVGGTVVVATESDRHDLRRLQDLIRNYGVTHAAFTPSLTALFANLRFPSLQKLIIAGEKMLPAIQRMASSQPFDLINGYGPTENTVMATFAVVREGQSLQNIGRPAPGTVAHVLGATDLQPVAPGEVGELCIGGRQLTAGYINRPELNAACFFDNPFDDRDLAPRLYHTGDMVRLLPDGTLEYVGRIDDRVKYNGYRIELQEIERVIEQSPAVVQACVSLEQTGSRQQLTAYLKLARGDARLLDEVKKRAASFLPEFMRPSRWVAVDDFPKNIHGKTDKGQLARLASQSATGTGGYAGASEELVAEVIAHLVGQESIDPEADLFDEVGLTSLQAMQVPVHLEVSGLHYVIDDLYKHRTVRRMVENHEVKRGWWYNEPAEGKPVLVVVSGYTSFTLVFGTMARTLADSYAIYVIESYHDYPDELTASCDVLTDSYMELLAPIAERYGVEVITGFCVGGDIALATAKKLCERTGMAPHVVSLDGEIDRNADPEKDIPVYFDMLSPEMNRLRIARDRAVVGTMNLHGYPGPVTAILCARRVPDYQPFATQTEITAEQVRWMNEYFDRAPRWWKEAYPDCTLRFVDANHDTMFSRPESKAPMFQYFLSLVGRAKPELDAFHFVEGRLE
ncbi:MAG: amino acid adenylation domain-containing protein [Alloprevotella sp.]